MARTSAFEVRAWRSVAPAPSPAVQVARAGAGLFHYAEAEDANNETTFRISPAHPAIAYGFQLADC